MFSDQFRAIIYTVTLEKILLNATKLHSIFSLTKLPYDLIILELVFMMLI